ncbi:MAG: zinc ribbon domain-containing protein [Desulfuromonadaceae bacterium]|nr:zinc ribbon domain-containing protein [Desulfuromonadaceae bacterium]
MPIFEYRCPHCGKVTEKISRCSEQQIDCPVCGGKAQRVLSVFSSHSSSSVRGVQSHSGCG